MLILLLIALAGFAAQLVDGGLGMGFGATSTTLLITLAGLGPAQASAAVHAAQLGTTLASGATHWRFGNVDWKVALALAVPGSVAAFLGATLLANLHMDAARPITAAILLCIGINLMWRFSRGRVQRTYSQRNHGTGFLGALGFIGGFVDSTGGGGWGPITTSTLLSAGRIEPRRVVGTVCTAEFSIAAAATFGFAFGMWEDLVSNLLTVAALLIGGVIAAPIAAWSVTRLNPVILGSFVGTLLVLLNVPTVLGALDAPEEVLWLVRGAVLLIGINLGVHGFKAYSRNKMRLAAG
ncbi:sulfite exporter TauE/SafE family protein [Corynebacterium endometrii]|uniref:Probable membrane transporter protein n=1 Tax=Corynebacterium endometrii TaxID=2488819 RepID=A0A4P7QIH1_9CORY|nr:sulfite exporter TauE/SafE family protein [Corynebacterium endometrii]QCB29330.1 Sulfite exporter TauE/SafE [Corynebacterium endometrii]